MLKYIKCSGEGQGSCKRCSDNGKWNRQWMCFLYEVERLPGCYCHDCVKILSDMSEASMFELSTREREKLV